MRFLLNAIMIAVVVWLALRVMHQPILLARQTVDPATIPNAAPLIGTAELEQLLHTGQKETVLFVYTSWCTFCKKQFPIMDDFARNTPSIQIIGFSLDKDMQALASYLSAKSAPPAFKTFQYNGAGSFAGYLKNKGSNFNGGIPYIAVFDRNGKLVKQATGVMTIESLRVATHLD